MQPAPRIGLSLGALALPTFALALGISVLTTYAPLLLGEATSSAGAIGLAVGAEGAFALFLPLLIGSLSDRTRSRLGRRIPYALVGVPLLVVPLVILPFAHGFAETVALVSLFFIGYHIYYPPYQALFAELVPLSHQGRSQGWQGVMRGLGLGVALVAGGLLLSVWTPLPFLLAAAAAVVATVVLVREVGGKERPVPVASPSAPRGPGVLQLVRERRDVRAFVAANALWELSFMGLKTFIVLFVVKGLGESVGTASAVIGVVAGAYVVAAFGAGRVADAVGLHRLMRIAVWVYGVGLLVGAGLSTLDSFLLGLPFIALAGAVVMTLPFGILAGMTPAGAEGALSGLFGFSRALGAVLGPIVVGVAIDVLAPVFPATNGYGAMWIAIGAPILLSLPLLRGLRGEEPKAEPRLPRAEPAVAALDELALAA
ncbi:MAG TPA: MFS transporter [Gaiellaceae bacterium]|nr:MFS transporter [Gaiellaceae bacterium]